MPSATAVALACWRLYWAALDICIILTGAFLIQPLIGLRRRYWQSPARRSIGRENGYWWS